MYISALIPLILKLFITFYQMDRVSDTDSLGMSVTRKKSPIELEEQKKIHYCHIVTS